MAAALEATDFLPMTYWWLNTVLSLDVDRCYGSLQTFDQGEGLSVLLCLGQRHPEELLPGVDSVDPRLWQRTSLRALFREPW